MEQLIQHCINCSLRLRHMRRQALREVDPGVINILITWISPTPVSLDAVLCLECFACLQSALQAGSDSAPQFGHASICFVCGASILRVRSSRVPVNSVERSIILTWISPHLIRHLKRVCRACWMAAKRNVQQHLEHDIKREGHTSDTGMARDADVSSVHNPEPPPLAQVDPLFLPEQQHLEHDIKHEVHTSDTEMAQDDDTGMAQDDDTGITRGADVSSLHIPEPPPLPKEQQHSEHDFKREGHTSDTEMAQDADTGMARDADVSTVPEPPPLPKVNQFPPRIKKQQESRVVSHTYKRAAMTTRHCIFPNCKNVKRLLIPRSVREVVLKRRKIYIPSCARICKYHLYVDCWDQLEVNYSDFTGAQMDDLLAMMENI